MNVNLDGIFCHSVKAANSLTSLYSILAALPNVLLDPVKVQAAKCVLTPHTAGHTFQEKYLNARYCCFNCRARYIFEEPVCQDYKIAFYSGTHWKAFQVINLEENHRQLEDRNYADFLNRIRVGQQTQADIELL